VLSTAVYPGRKPCCGCGKVLSSAKKHFVQGHDGKAKAMVRKIMRGELQPQDAPPELILRHSEIKFIVLSPEFQRVVEYGATCVVSPALPGIEQPATETD